MFWIICLVIVAGATATLGYFKLRFAYLALKDVPPEQRVEVLDAIGRVYEKWRLR